MSTLEWLREELDKIDMSEVDSIIFPEGPEKGEVEVSVVEDAEVKKMFILIKRLQNKLDELALVNIPILRRQIKKFFLGQEGDNDDELTIINARAEIDVLGQQISLVKKLKWLSIRMGLTPEQHILTYQYDSIRIGRGWKIFAYNHSATVLVPTGLDELAGLMSEAQPTRH